MNVLLGMPTIGSIPLQTVTSLLAITRADINVAPMLVANSLVYTARDLICEFATEQNFDAVLFVDSDMVFNPKDYYELMNVMAEKNLDMVSGTYCTRLGDPRIVAYKKVEKRTARPFRKANIVNVDMKSECELEEVAAVGMGFCLIKTSLLKKMMKDYASLFEPKWGVGEDIAFCIRAKQYTDIMLDREVKLGHLGQQVINVPISDLESRFVKNTTVGTDESEVRHEQG